MKFPPGSIFVPLTMIKYCAAAIPCSLLITLTISPFGSTYATEVESLQQFDEHEPSLASPQARSKEHGVELLQHAEPSLPPGSGRPKEPITQPVVSNTGNPNYLPPPSAGAPANGRPRGGASR